MEFNFGYSLYYIPKEIMFEIFIYILDPKTSCLLSRKEASLLNLRLVSKMFYILVNHYIGFAKNKKSRNCISVPFIWLKLGIQISSNSVYISKKQFSFLIGKNDNPLKIKNVKVLDCSLKDLLDLGINFIECLEIYDFESFFSKIKTQTENCRFKNTFLKLKKVEIKIYKFECPQENNKLVLLYQWLNQIYQYSKNEITLKITNLSNYNLASNDCKWEQIYQNFLLPSDFIESKSFRFMIHTLILKDIAFGLPEHFENLQVLKIINTRNKTNIHLNVFYLLKRLESLHLTNLNPILETALKLPLVVK